MKIWIYQNERAFTDAEKKSVAADLSEFIDRWSAHGKKLKAGFEMPHSHFIVMKVDEVQALASGCSIDESVRFIKSLEQKYGFSLFNRQNVAYLDEGVVKLVRLQALSDLYRQGIINENTLVFNNLVQGEEEYSNRWKSPIKDTGYMAFCM